MLSAWVAIGLHLSQENQRVFPILLVFSSESDDSFPGQFYFTDSFETQGSYMYGCSFVKSDKYSSSEISLSSIPLFSSSEALSLFRVSDFDFFMVKPVLSSKFTLSFLSLLDILYKKAYSTIVFLNAMTSMIRKRLIIFSFK